MPDLRRLAIIAAKPKELASFYQHVFELEVVAEEEGIVTLSDGVFSLALLPLSPGRQPGIHALGFETARMESLHKHLDAWEKNRSSIQECVPPTAEIEYELQDPDQNIIGLCHRAFDTAYETRPVPIRHVALFTPDPQRLANFYCAVFDMKEVQRSDRSSIFLSDGYVNLALLFQRKEEPLGLNHFGFHVKDNEEMQRRAERAGARPGSARPARIPFAEFRVHDPEGNGIDISQKGWKV